MEVILLDAIRQWAFALCAAMVACGIAQLLLPKSNLESMFKLVSSVFFLCCLLSPVILRFPDIRVEAQQYSDALIEEKAQRLSSVVERQTQESAEKTLEKNIAEKLRQMGINYYAITININTSGQSDGDVSVDIVLDKSLEPGHDKLAARLEAALGVDVRLGYQTAKEANSG